MSWRLTNQRPPEPSPHSPPSNVERDFATALIAPATPRIIGVPMRPFALGHRLLLEQIQSSFVCGTFPGYGDLISTAFICAHTWRENQKLMRSPLRRWFTLRIWGIFAGKFNIPVAILALHRYVKDGSDYPEVQEKPGDMKQLAMPHLARLYLFLRTHGFGEHEAMDMPLVAANILYCAEAEQAGRLDMVTDTFKDMVRASQGGGAA